MSTRQKFECHVISNTHWDREWLKPFQVYRMRFVDYCDKLLDILENDPDYKHYHLDSQSITLEDYLEIRPENAKRVKKLVKSGKLLAGPWYDLPDMNMVDGECLVRNLLRGHKLCKEYGAVMKVGYTPTSAGQIAQLPQIYRGFGIDSAFFYRGINRETAPTEYIWRAPDGSEVIGIRPPRFGRGNFWVHSILPVVHGVYFDKLETCEYKFEGGGQPFRLDGENETSYMLLSPKRYYNEHDIAERFQMLLDDIMPDMTTTHIPAFDGHDHNSPHLETPRIIADINRMFPDIHAVHSSLPQYIDAVRESLKGRKNIKTVEGEMRHTNHSAPGSAQLYPGSLTTRIYLKQENRKTENLLLRQAEPAAVMAASVGLSYPEPYFDLAWRLLLTNQSHDCIMGCSVDKVHEDMMYRFSEAQCIAGELFRRSIAEVTGKIDTQQYPRDAAVLVCFNFLSSPRNAVVKIAVDLPTDAEGDTLRVRDNNGRDVPVQMISANALKCSLESEGFMLGMPVRRYEAYVHVKELPATGYRTLSVASASVALSPQDSLGKSDNILENAYLRVEFNTDGTFDITDKATGATSSGLNYFEDRGEVGNAWVPKQPEHDRVVISRGGKATIRLVENGSLRATFETTVKMRLPTDASNDSRRRSRRTKTVAIVSRISLTKNGRAVDVETIIDNTVKDHKLRAMFPTGIGKAESSFAATPFHVVERPIKTPDGKGWIEPPWPIYPNSGFVDVSDGTHGVAIVNQGLLEYQVIDDSERTVALTLLKGIWQRGNGGGKPWPDIGYQCLGEHRVRYAVYPHKGNWQNGNVYQQLNEQCSPVRVAQCAGGYAGSLPPEQSFLEVTPDIIQVSAVKIAENDDKSVVLRLFNPGSQAVDTAITWKDRLKQVKMLDMEENAIGDLQPDGNCVTLAIAPHKIVTLCLEQVL